MFTHKNSVSLLEGNPLSLSTVSRSVLLTLSLLPLTDHTSADLWPVPPVKDCCLSKHTSREGEKKGKQEVDKGGLSLPHSLCAVLRRQRYSWWRPVASGQ